MIQMNEKVIVNFGDSIFGNMNPPNDISSILAKLTGATVYNCAFGGCRMSRHAEHWDALSMYRLADAVATGDFSYQDSIPMDELIEQGGMLRYFPKRIELLKKIDFNKVDIVTIAFGTNDYTARKRIDVSDDGKNTDTYMGALRYSIETLLNAYPHLKIFICSPSYRFWHEDDPGKTFYERPFRDDSDTCLRFNNRMLPEFVEAARQVAKEYHLKFIDLYYELGINKYNKEFYLLDGTHHNPEGTRLIAEFMANELF